MNDSINYSEMIQDAMRGMIHNVILDVSKFGLPGKHHFMIVFDTSHPKIDMPAWLRKEYPKEMTILIQNWYENLNVDTNGFKITLSFNDAPEKLYIPFDSIKTFVDPSVSFGIQLEPKITKRLSATISRMDTEAGPRIVDDDNKEKIKHNQKAEVVSLDAFRNQSKSSSSPEPDQQ